MLCKNYLLKKLSARLEELRAEDDFLCIVGAGVPDRPLLPDLKN